MTDEKPPLKKRVSSSDELPAVKAFRRKLESIDENVMPMFLDLNKSIERGAVSSSHPPSKIDEEEREGPPTPPREVVPDPFPSSPPEESDEEEKEKP